MKAFLFSICAAWALQPMLAWGQTQAQVIETTQSMKTYPFSDPDPVADPTDLFYPYFRFDGFAAKGTSKNWKVVEMENDFIKLRLFPEIGGKVWGAVDKTTGKEFIYDNHVVKFRDIAMRGPWVSGGIEFNFGIIGHAPTSSTPIDYYTQEKADGSVSCYIASYEWVTRTYWNVEVNLPKDKAYFTTTTTWYNQSSVDQPYYQWMNAGYPAAGNAQFCYPGDHYIGHDGELFPFPVDSEERDLSWYKNNNFGSSKSEHVLGLYNDYYGIYWHEDNFGSVHHAAYDEKLGMKIFLWGQARDGAIWEELLTDADGQYIELQSGRMFNQPASNSAYSPYKHHAFGAQMTDSWTEYWFPVKGINGISKASRIGALHVVRQGSSLSLAFSPLDTRETTLRIFDGEQEVKQLALHTKTLEPWQVTLDQLGKVPEGRLRVVIGDQDLVYSERSEDSKLSRPKTLPNEFDWNSVYGLYTQGEQWMNQKVLDKAEAFLTKALAKDPYFAPALNRLASLYYREGRFDESLDLLKRSLSLNAYDDEANYLSGLCHRQLGHSADAKDGFSVATYSVAFRSAAYAQLAEISVKEQNWKQAEHYALRSLDYNRMNLNARQVLMLMYRKTGQVAKAQAQVEEVLAQLPLYHFARFEKLCANGLAAFQVQELQTLVRNELPFETFMELAGWYESVGCIDEAIALLSCAHSYPIACYKRAYLLHQLGKTDEARRLVAEADAVSPQQVFPFRAETLKALEWVTSVSESWKPVYYRALICWANQRKSEADQLLESCAAKPDYAPFYLTRAKLRKTMKGNDSSLEDLLLAEKISPSWRTGFALLQAYTEQKDWQHVVTVGKRYMKKYPSNYYLGLKLANGLCEMGQYVACIRLLQSLDVLPNEGAYAGRAVYRAANLYQAMDYLHRNNPSKAQKALDASMEWPENLGVGKPYDDQIDSRLESYMQARIFAKQGRKTESEEALKQVAQHHNNQTRFVSADLLSALALRELGQEGQANEWVASWKQNFAENRVSEWANAIYNGDLSKADQLLESRHDPKETTPWETGYRDVDCDLIIRFMQAIRIQ